MKLRFGIELQIKFIEEAMQLNAFKDQLKKEFPLSSIIFCEDNKDWWSVRFLVNNCEFGVDSCPQSTKNSDGEELFKVLHRETGI